MSRILVFDHIEDKQDISWKRLYEKVLWIFKRTCGNIIHFGKIKLLPLIKQELKPHDDAKVCYIFGKKDLEKAL